MIKAQDIIRTAEQAIQWKWGLRGKSAASLSERFAGAVEQVDMKGSLAGLSTPGQALPPAGPISQPQTKLRGRPLKFARVQKRGLRLPEVTPPIPSQEEPFPLSLSP